MFKNPFTYEIHENVLKARLADAYANCHTNNGVLYVNFFPLPSRPQQRRLYRRLGSRALPASAQTRPLCLRVRVRWAQ